MTSTPTLHALRRAAAALVVAGAVAGLAGPATAAASTVDIGDMGPAEPAKSLIYRADPGENNKVEITKLSTWIVRVDDVYAIDLTAEAEERCDHPFLLDGTVVDCSVIDDRWLFLEDGNDTVTPGEGIDYVNGGPGFDRVLYSERTDPVAVTVGDGPNDGEVGEKDSIGSDVEGVTGGSGNDTIADLAGYANGFDGGPGDDLIAGGDGWDATLLGGPGSDTIYGAGGQDMLWGNGGDDHLYGGPEADFIDGGDDQDRIHSADGVKDSVFCGAGIDRAKADTLDSPGGCERFG